MQQLTLLETTGLERLAHDLDKLLERFAKGDSPAELIPTLRELALRSRIDTQKLLADRAGINVALLNDKFGSIHWSKNMSITTYEKLAGVTSIANDTKFRPFYNLVETVHTAERQDLFVDRRQLVKLARTGHDIGDLLRSVQAVIHLVSPKPSPKQIQELYRLLSNFWTMIEGRTFEMVISPPPGAVFSHIDIVPHMLGYLEKLHALKPCGQDDINDRARQVLLHYSNKFSQNLIELPATQYRSRHLDERHRATGRMMQDDMEAAEEWCRRSHLPGYERVEQEALPRWTGDMPLGSDIEIKKVAHANTAREYIHELSSLGYPGAYLYYLSTRQIPLALRSDETLGDLRFEVRQACLDRANQEGLEDHVVVALEKCARLLAANAR